MANATDTEIVERVDFNLIPLRALNVLSRRILSRSLEAGQALSTSSGITRDWQGLCELADFNYDMIKLFKSHQDPVVIMLEFWAKQQTSIAQLINALEVMERFDIIEDIQPLLKRDALAYLRNEEREGRTLEPLKPREDIEIDSTVTDKYDAYVSYGDSDADFASKLIQELEGNFKLRLFVKDRDLLPGVIETEADLHLINERCDKILLIVSQETLNNPNSEFQTVLAQAAAVGTGNNQLAKRLIPIVCKPCALPQRFKYLAKLDYNKIDLFGSFWKRLYFTIKSDITDPDVPNSSVGYTSLSPEITTISSTGPLLDLNTVGPYGAHNSPQPSSSQSPLLKKNALAYLRKEEREGRTLEPLKPREVIKIISGGNSTTPPVTVSDVVESSNESTVTDKYDAYVSYGDSDADFASELIQKMEGNFKLRLFVKGRDLLPGVIETEPDLHLINERCDKILLIVSQESLNNPYSEFQTVLAQAAAVDSSLYARKLIPIICKPCALPQRFKYLAKLDYNKKDLFGSFWKRLCCSIKSEINDAYFPDSTVGCTSLSPEITTVSSTGPLLSLNTVGPYGVHSAPQPSPPI